MSPSHLLRDSRTAIESFLDITLATIVVFIASKELGGPTPWSAMIFVFLTSIPRTIFLLSFTLDYPPPLPSPPRLYMGIPMGHLNFPTKISLDEIIGAAIRINREQ
jgi:hypothetical protein